MATPPSDRLAPAAATAVVFLALPLMAGTADPRPLAGDPASAGGSPALPAAPAATVELTPVADTYVVAAQPGVNYGTQTGFMVGTGGNFVEARGLVRFDLSSIPAGSVVTEARLELTLVALEGGTNTVDLRRALAAWTETTVTWDNQPGGASPFSSLVVGTDLVVYEWPVTDVVRDWVSGAAANRGLVLHGTGGLRGFGSRERASGRPKLIVTYQPPTATPSATATSSVTATASPTGLPPGCVETLSEGGFEGNPAAEWFVESNNQNPVFVSEADVGAGFEAHGGERVAWLAGVDLANVVLRQLSNMPPDATSARLSYWWLMDTTDQGMNGDGLRVAVGHLDADETLASQSNLDERRVWKRAEFDISNWAGSPDLHVLFVAATNAVAPTSFFIDDVSLIACSVATATSSPTAPSPTATALPTGTASPTTASPPSPSPSLTSSPSPSASASRTSTATSSPTTRPSVTPTGSPTPPAYCANDDFEPNDTIAQAAPLLPDIEYQLRLCPSEEFDHFRIAVPAGQRFVVRVAPTGEQNVALTLFDATGIFLDHADRYGAGSPYIAETLTGRSASAALYVVRVSAPTTAQPMPGQGGAGVLYRITVRLGDLDLWVEPSVNRPGGAAALVGQGLGAAAGPTPCDLVVHSGAPDRPLGRATIAQDGTVRVPFEVASDAFEGTHFVMSMLSCPGRSTDGIAQPTQPALPDPLPRASFLVSREAFEPPVIQCAAGNRFPTMDIAAGMLEITQAVQCMDATDGDTACTDNSVPLVEGRLTAVRLYMSVANVPFGDAVPGVTGQLYVRRPGEPEPGTPIPASNPAIAVQGEDGGPPLFLRHWRERTNGTLNFRIPRSLATGDLLVRAQLWVSPLCGYAEPEGAAANNWTVEREISFTPRRQVSLGYLPVRYEPEPPCAFAGPPLPGPEIERGATWLRRVLPLKHSPTYHRLPAEVSFGRCLEDAEDASSAWRALNIRLNVTLLYYIIRQLVAGDPSDPPIPDQLVGWVPYDEDPSHLGPYSGWADAPYYYAGSGHVLGAVARQDQMELVLAHEIGHNMGLHHPDCSPPDWPYGSDGVQETGFDVDLMEAVASTSLDMMAAGGLTESSWLSPFTTAWLFERDLQPESNPGYSDVACEAPPRAALQQSGPSGRPWLRADSPAARARRTSAATGEVAGSVQVTGSGTSSARSHQGGGSVLVVAGEVERNGTGQITEVLQLDADPEAVRAAWPVPPPGDDYCVTQIDRQSVATDTCFEVLFGGEEGRSETASLFLVLDEAEDADTVKLELRLGADGRVVDTIVESANDPVVRVLSPNGGQEWTGPGPIRWEVSDPDGDELALSVLYSEDGGASWEPISVGLESSGGVVDAPVQGEFEWDSSRFAGSDNALVRVTASDGLRTVSDESDAPFRLNENGPAVSIEAPLDGARFVHSGQVILRGQAFDPEDGSLAGSSLAWRVDERGWVGAGDEVVAPRLSWGNHVVTLTATDSSGRTSSASVRIRVDVRAWIPSVRQR